MFFSELFGAMILYDGFTELWSFRARFHNCTALACNKYLVIIIIIICNKVKTKILNFLFWNKIKIKSGLKFNKIVFNLISSISKIFYWEGISLILR